jgi:hypothetical protein
MIAAGKTNALLVEGVDGDERRGRRKKTLYKKVTRVT